MAKREGQRRWVGAPVPPLEHRELVAGRAEFVSDVALPGMLQMAVLRSPHAHARLVRVDAAAAARAPGVAAVLTGAEVLARSEPLRNMQRLPGQRDPQLWALAHDRVRYVGEPVAVVAATSRYLAEDALDLIVVEYDPLPAIVAPEAALAPDAPLLYDDWGSNEQARFTVQSGDVDAALAQADLVLHERFEIQRQGGMPMEGRALLASYDPPTGILTLRSSLQKPHMIRTVLAQALRFSEAQIRVLVPHIGGGFGTKGDLYREDVLVALLAMQTGQPVQWTEDRREHFLGTVQAREQVHEVTAGFRRDGTLLAVRDRFLANVGARLHTIGMGPSAVTARMLPGPYRFQHYDSEMRCIVTNKVPAGSYRGYGNPQANFVMERLMDLAAARLGLDPADVRRHNLLRPDELPYRSASGQSYDTGDYPTCLEQALALAGYADVRGQQAAWRAAGRHVGVGIACYVEGTALPGTAPEPAAGPGGPPANYERVMITVDQTGHATVYSGLMGMGQGLGTALAQIAADEIGLDPARVHVVFGDTALCAYSPGGSAASRSLVMGGAAVKLAGRKLRDTMRRLAGHALEVAPDDLEFRDGRFTPRGAPDRGITVEEIARLAYSPSRLPPGEDVGLQAVGTYLPSGRPYTYGAHVAVVEVFPETGELQILKYVIVDDCGVVINPLIVTGQIHGGVAQGMAGALYEELVYDPSGQLLNASFMDYLIPTAMEIPPLVLGHLESPSTLVPGGMKGVGESGTISPPAALANAVCDALRPLDVSLQRTPLHPERIWAASAARAASAPA